MNKTNGTANTARSGVVFITGTAIAATVALV